MQETSGYPNTENISGELKISLGKHDVQQSNFEEVPGVWIYS